MIRINLLPRKKRKRKAAPIEGEQTVAIGLGIAMAFCACLYFFVHVPQQDELETKNQSASKMRRDNNAITEKTKDFDSLKASFESKKKQDASIKVLNDARATPANFLFELASILKKDGGPSMTEEMVEKVKLNENLLWQKNWDPSNVWIETLKEAKGKFTLVGAAQSDGDATQLAHRLSASMYFDDVQPEGSAKKAVKAGGTTVYRFTITGKVRY